MHALILAAGRGARMEGLTESCPKPMLLLLGKPLLEWKMEMLPDEIDNIILIIGYMGDTIRSYFGDTWKGKSITYIMQEELNGTAGATALAKDVASFPLLVTMGDDLYTKEDLEHLLEEKAALLVMYTDNALRFGIIESTEDGYLKGVKERPHGMKEGLVSTNAILLPKEYFDIPMVPISATEYGLPQTLSEMSKIKPVRLVEATKWLPIG